MEPRNYYSTRYFEESKETQLSQSQGQQPGYRLILQIVAENFQGEPHPKLNSILALWANFR